MRWDREIRFYGQRSPIRVGAPIVLAVVPDRMGTDSFRYQWYVGDCWGGRVNGATTGPIFAFAMTRAGSCNIQLRDGHDTYQFSYYVAH